MSTIRFSDASLLILRLTIVFVFLYHGIPKALNWAMASEKFVSMGFPGFLGPITGIVEVVMSVFILLGLYPKVSNLLLSAIIAGAITGVHIPASISSSTVTAGLERDLMLLAGLLVSAALGSNTSTERDRSALENL